MSFNDEVYKRFLHNLLNLFSPSERHDLIDRQCHIFDKTIVEVTTDFYEYLHSYLESELRKINSSPTIVETKLKKASLDEWLKNHIPDKQDRQQVYDSLVIKEHKSEYYQLDDLLNLKKDKDDYIVSELVRKGEFLMLAAAPKTGKSLLITNLAMAIITGSQFLNRKTYPTNILFINNEENPLEVGKRLYYQGLQEIEAKDKSQFEELVKSDRFFLCKYLDIVQDYEEMLEKIQEKNIGLVLIDSLGASIKKSGMTEYSTELLPYLYSIQEDICHKLGVSCIMLHHTTKMDNPQSKTSMLNGISGGSFLTRANDGYWKLMAGGKDERDTLSLTCVPRNDKEKTFILTIIEDEACKWEFSVLKESSIPESELEIQNQVLYLFKQAYEAWFSQGSQGEVIGYTLTELLENIGCDRKTLVRVINRMLHSEAIERYIYDQNHVYHYPYSGESWMDIFLERDLERLEEKNKLEKLKSQVLNTIKPILSSNERMDYVSCWQFLKENMPSNFSILNCLTEEDKDKFLSYLHNSKYKLGAKVKHKDKETLVIKAIYTPSNKSDDKFLYVLKDSPESFVVHSDLTPI